MRRRFSTHLLVWAIWAIPPLVHVAVSLADYKGRLLRVAAVEVVPWWYWAFWTLPIIDFARAHPAETLRSLRGVLRHLVAGILIGTGCGIISMVVALAVGEGGTRSVGELVLKSVLFWAVFGLVFYTLITAIGFVIDANERLRERERSAAQLEARLVEAQLSGLRMQLQPHFLFNTLNTVAMYVREGDAGTSIRVLTGLSELLRRVLDTESQQEVTLGTELEHVQRYLDIERLRFSDRLVIEIDVPDDLRQARFPNLALQPLVENAIRHGIAHRTDVSRIALSAERRDGELVVRVYNDGPAVPEGIAVENGAGIGLRNTAMRLHHLYADRGQISLRDENGGVVAEIRLPYHV